LILFGVLSLATNRILAYRKHISDEIVNGKLYNNLIFPFAITMSGLARAYLLKEEFFIDFRYAQESNADDGRRGKGCEGDACANRTIHPKSLKG
jgi:hypothetical protein